MKSFYFILTFVLFTIGIVGCLDTSETLPDKEVNNLAQEQITAQLQGMTPSVQLSDFDHIHSTDEDWNAYRINWSELRETPNGNEIIWEIPISSPYNSAIVAGRKDGKLFQPFRLEVRQHVLFRKNLHTEEITGELLTFLGENTKEIYSENITEWEGFVISSDLKGEINITHKIHDGKTTKILAGNAELQKQEKDFYCFCFETDNKMLMTKHSDEYDTFDTICIFCHHPINYCTCDRCPDCGNTSPICSCGSCHICGKQKPECICQTICESCKKNKYQCMCKPIVTPIPCPNCRHNPCVCSTPVPSVCPDCNQNPCRCSTPTLGCSCTNIYCLGGKDCNCRYTSSCSCPACLSGNCQCQPRVTPTS